MRRITKAQLSALLFKHDLEGFGGMGAPEDEYDYEAELLWELIETHRNVMLRNPPVSDIEEFILRAFLFTFATAGENPYEAGKFREAAQEVYEAL